VNRAIASIYAISITHDGHPLTTEQKCAIADRVPDLIKEFNRLEEIANDPFVRGYIEARKQWSKP